MMSSFRPPTSFQSGTTIAFKAFEKLVLIVLSPTFVGQVMSHLSSVQRIRSQLGPPEDFPQLAERSHDARSGRAGGILY